MGIFFGKKKRRHLAPETLTLSEEQVVTDNLSSQQDKLEKISSELQDRLKNELNGLISEIVDYSIDQTRAEIEQLIRNQLVSQFEDKLDTLVEQAIKTHLTKPKPISNNNED